MSVGQLLQPNSYNIFVKTINGITTEDISGTTNENGQVLTIIDKNEKKVAFLDVPSGIPDTIGFPDGYVLKIIDNTQNQVSWEPDIGGGAAIPFILTGDSVNALKVQTSTLEPMIRIDTVDREVHMSAIRNMVEGVDDEKKFSVFNNSDPVNPVFNIDTLNTKLEINNGLSKKGEIVLNNTPETLIPGVDSSVNMKLQYDAGGAGDTNFVGYVTKNGPSAMFNLVNKDTAGLIFLTDVSSGIQTTAQELNISSFNPIGKMRAQFNQEILLEANGCELNVGNNNIIETSSKFVIDGSNNAEKFVVKDSAENKVLWVDTTSDSVYISGNNASGAKLGVQNALGDFIFVVDTNNTLLRMGNANVNPSEIDLKPSIGVIEVSGKTGGVLKTAYKLNHTINPSGGSVEMSAYRDNTDYNKIESTGALGLLISSDTVVNVSGSTEFLTAAPTTSFSPIDSTGLCNKSYVDDRVGGLSSGTLPSNQALGNILTSQSINPVSFLPNPPVTPVNYLKGGQSYQLIMSGDAQFSNGNDFTITLVASNNGSPVTLGSVQILVPNVGGLQTWELEADFTVRSVVANIANIYCSFDFTYNDNQAFVGKRSLTSTNSLNVTFPQTLTTNVTFASGGALNNIQTQLYILKKVVDV